MLLLGFRRKLTALALCKSMESAIQWFQIHHRITFATIQNSAVYLLGARISICSTLVPRLSGTNRIKRDILMQEYDRGGLKMINLKNYKCALKSIWIRRLLANDLKYVSVFESKYTKIKDLINRGLEFTKGLLKTRTTYFGTMF